MSSPNPVLQKHLGHNQCPTTVSESDICPKCQNHPLGKIHQGKGNGKDVRNWSLWYQKVRFDLKLSLAEVQGGKPSRFHSLTRSAVVPPSTAKLVAGGMGGGGGGGGGCQLHRLTARDISSVQVSTDGRWNALVVKVKAAQAFVEQSGKLVVPHVPDLTEERALVTGSGMDIDPLTTVQNTILYDDSVLLQNREMKLSDFRIGPHGVEDYTYGVPLDLFIFDEFLPGSKFDVHMGSFNTPSIPVSQSLSRTCGIRNKLTSGSFRMPQFLGSSKNASLGVDIQMPNRLLWARIGVYASVNYISVIKRHFLRAWPLQTMCIMFLEDEMCECIESWDHLGIPMSDTEGTASSE
ncbi:hypothetical protein DFH09DRAFT_1097715 [Mycena vulgaris]|nr:hypothetical protein DFH09DRAFT_1097715 [Mycena vulgaris]